MLSSIAFMSSSSELARVVAAVSEAVETSGSDALGGVMSFTTQKPLLRYKDNPKKYNLNGYVRFSTANFERTGHIDFNIGGETFASLSSLTYSDFSDLRAGRIKSDTNMARYWNRYFYVEYDPVDSVDVVRTNENPNVHENLKVNENSLNP